MKKIIELTNRLWVSFLNLFHSKHSLKLIFIFTGIASTIWFLVRVLPKPQRAGYPCMRAAAPLMSGFVLYVITLAGSVLFFRKAFDKFKQAKYLTAVLSLLVCMILLAVFNINDTRKIFSNTLGTNWTKGVLPDSPNTPMGKAQGIFAGRVAWVWNASATNENCTNVIDDAYFMPENNNQDTIDRMADNGIKIIGGKSTVKDSWDAIFKSFNAKKTGTASGYTAGQTIFIKVNNGQAGWAINKSDLSETGNNSSTGVDNAAMSNTTPAAVLAYVRQLVDTCGIPQDKIYIAEPMTHVYKSLYDAIHPSYPNVKILDKDGYTNLGRTKTTGWTSDVIFYSDKGKVMPDAVSDAIMKEMNTADYLINIAALKAHARAGVTFCAKLHFGSHGSHDSYGYGSFHLHNGLIATVDNDVMTSGLRGSYNMYRVLVDLMGHEKLGGNTVLFVVDGLWGGIEATDMPVKWKSAPFNNDFPNSLFMSQDEIALESVCLDFLRAEAEVNTAFKNRPFFPAVDDYLHQGAEKANWPTDISYDPEGDGTPISSLGIHEHWNSSATKQYSRNLYSNGTGIELVAMPKTLVSYGNETADNLTFTVTSGGTPVSDAIVNVKGSVALTDADGKVVFGNIKQNSSIDYTVKKKGYTDFTGNTVVTADANVAADLGLPSAILTNRLNENSVKIYPNPCTIEAEISYTLKSSTSVEMYVINLEGKIITKLANGYFEEGTHSLKLSTVGFSKGLYICVLKTDNGIKTSKIEVR